MEDHIRPAGVRAGITKRVGWHVFRHSYGTLLKSSGRDVKTTQELMRHANASVTMDTYVQAVTLTKRKAPSGIVGLFTGKMAPNGPTQLTERVVTA